MMLRKKWMSVAVALGVLLGASESYAVLDAEQTKLKAQITAQGLDVDDEDIPVFSVMSSKFVPLLADKWKEAKAAGMSSALIRVMIGTKENQAALDVLTTEIAQRKGTTASTVSAPSTPTDNASGDSSSPSTGSSSSASSLSSTDKAANSSTNVPASLTLKDVDEAIQKYHPNLPPTFTGKEQLYAHLLSKAKTKDDLSKLAQSLKVGSVDPSLQPTPEQYKVVLEKQILPEKYAELRKLGYSFDEIIQNAQDSRQFEAFLAKAREKAKSTTPAPESKPTTPAAESKPTTPAPESKSGTYNIRAELLYGLFPEFQKVPNLKSPQNMGPVLEKIQHELEDARSAGFTDKQITGLWLRGLAFSKWRDYLKLPGMNPTTFYEAITKGGREAALAFFGLDEKKATILEGRSTAVVYSKETLNLINAQSALGDKLWYQKKFLWANAMFKFMKDDRSSPTSTTATSSSSSSANAVPMAQASEMLAVPPAPNASPLEVGLEDVLPPSALQPAPNFAVRSADANDVTVLEATKAGDIMLALTKSLGRNPTTLEIFTELKAKMNIDDKKAHAILEAMDIE